jgi:hypothetical protein
MDTNILILSVTAQSYYDKAVCAVYHLQYIRSVWVNVALIVFLLHHFMLENICGLTTYCTCLHVHGDHVAPSEFYPKYRLCTLSVVDVTALLKRILWYWMVILVLYCFSAVYSLCVSCVILTGGMPPPLGYWWCRNLYCNTKSYV